MLKNFEYRPVGDTGAGIYIDGQKIDGVTSIVFEHSVSEVPRVQLEIVPLKSNISQLADLDLRISSESVEQAVECLRATAILDDDFKSDLRGRIYDLLREASDNDLVHTYEKANFITERILEDLQ